MAPPHPAYPSIAHPSPVLQESPSLLPRPVPPASLPPQSGPALRLRAPGWVRAMGSGSSRSGRIPRRRRSPDRRQADPGEATSEGGTADQAPTAATQEETDPDPRPATPPGGREETLRLLDQLLAESETWGTQEPTPRGPARLPPAVSVGACLSRRILSVAPVSSHPGLSPYSAPLSPANQPNVSPPTPVCPRAL